MTDEILEYYELDEGQQVAVTFRGIWRAYASVPPLPRPPRYYLVTVRQMGIFLGPLLLFGMVAPSAYYHAVEALFGTSLPVVVISGIVHCSLTLVLSWLLLLPLGEWLAGIPVVVDAE